MTNYGYLYVASGTKFIREAEESAKTLKKTNTNYPLCIITDSKEYHTDLFDKIITVELPQASDNFKNGYLSKIVGMQYTPFEHTIFLDTDTYIVDHCDELFEVQLFFDLMICHDYSEKSYPIIKKKKLIGCNPYNTGVIAFQKTAQSLNFLKAWENCFLNNMEKYWSDQPAFMEALLLSEIKTYNLQTIYNFRFNQFMPISYGYVKVLHGRHSNISDIARIINKDPNHRSWDPRSWKCHSWARPDTFRERASKLILKARTIWN